VFLEFGDGLGLAPREVRLDLVDDYGSRLTMKEQVGVEGEEYAPQAGGAIQ
jgi:hypothetical protein